VKLETPAVVACAGLVRKVFVLAAQVLGRLHTAVQSSKRKFISYERKVSLVRRSVARSNSTFYSLQLHNGAGKRSTVRETEAATMLVGIGLWSVS
jgi:hypothetical protein